MYSLPFIPLPQSGRLMPNSISSLVLWLDVAEHGTLSRRGTSIHCVLDKSKYALEFTSSPSVSPKILQSKQDGKSLLKFDVKSKMIAKKMFQENINNLIVVAFINSTVQKMHASYLFEEKDNLIVLRGIFELGEILVFDATNTTMKQMDDVLKYMHSKWNC